MESKLIKKKAYKIVLADLKKILIAKMRTIASAVTIVA